MPEIEEEEEIHVEEDLLAYIDECTSNKETGAGEIHPKLLPLVLSVVFLMITLILVSFLQVTEIISSVNFGFVEQT